MRERAAPRKPLRGVICDELEPRILLSASILGDGEEVRLHYGEQLGPDYRVDEYDADAGAWSGPLDTFNDGSNGQWIVNAISPDASEEIVVIVDDNTNLTVRRFDGTSWSTDWTATNIANGDNSVRGVDVAFESSSGHAMVVYSDGDNNPVFRTWDGTSWSAAQSVYQGSPPATGSILWVELASRPGSDELALVYSDDDGDLSALIWDGDAWDESIAEELSTRLVSVHHRGFDAAYEESGELMIVWSEFLDPINPLDPQIDYVTLDPGGSSFTHHTALHIQQRTAEWNHVDVAAEPGGDRIALVAYDQELGAQRFGAMTWNGDAWQDERQLDQNFSHAAGLTSGEFWAAAGWVGSTGEAIAVYSDSSSGLNWANWTAGGGWSLGTDVAVAGSGLLESVQLQSLADRDELVAVWSDDGGSLWAASYAAGAWTVGNGGVALETNLSGGNAMPFHFDIERAPQPPAFVNNTISVTEGGTVVLDNTMIASTDPDNVDSALAYTVTGMTNGHFALGTDATTPILAFTQGQIDAGQIVFVHDGTEVAPTYTLQVSDGPLSDTQAGTVLFTPDNDPPAFVNNTISVTEGGTVVLDASMISATDPDHPDGTLSYTVTRVTNGRFAFSADASSAIVFFTQAQIDAGQVVFVHDGSESTPGYALEVSDGALSEVEVGNVVYTAVNDSPSLSAPGGQTVVWGDRLTFSMTGGNGIDFSDPDSPGSVVEVTLRATEGSVSLTDTAGLTFLIGDGDDDAVMRFRGDAADVRAAFDGLSFMSGSAYVGLAQLEIELDDLGGLLGGPGLTDTVTIPINVEAAQLSGPMLPNIDNSSPETEPEPERVGPDLESGDPEPEPSTTVEREPSIPGDPYVGNTLAVGTRSDDTRFESAEPPEFEMPPIENANDDYSVELADHDVRDFSRGGASLALTRAAEMLLWDALDQLRNDLSEVAEAEQESNGIQIAMAEGVLMVASSGLLALLLRGSSLAAVALSSLPLWSRVDPLAVLTLNNEERRRREKALRSAEVDEEEDEGIARILDDGARIG